MTMLVNFVGGRRFVPSVQVEVGARFLVVVGWLEGLEVRGHLRLQEQRLERLDPDLVLALLLLVGLFDSENLLLELPVLITKQLHLLQYLDHQVVVRFQVDVVDRAADVAT